MWAKDLVDLVQPMVSIDEYESKIDKDSIVIGFYVSDIDASKDLNRFILRSTVSIIDSEVSPAPDQKGYYMVFVEILKNDRLSDNIDYLLDEIKPLVDVDTWLVNCRGAKKSFNYDKAKLEMILKYNDKNDKLNDIKHKINKFKAMIKKAES